MAKINSEITKNFSLPTVYPITDRRLSGLSHAAQVREFIRGGARLVQLREKHLSPRDFYREAREAVELAHQHEVKILINDRADIALAVKADGVHLGQDDLPPEAARRVLGERAIIGFSTHSVEQATTARQMPIDYIAVGSIFSTSTKDKHELVGLETLENVRSAVPDFPLVAIGGITQQNAAGVMKHGADSVAIVGALLAEPNNIAVRTQHLIQTLATKF